MKLTLISSALALAFGMSASAYANPVVNGSDAGRGCG